MHLRRHRLGGRDTLLQLLDMAARQRGHRAEIELFNPSIELRSAQTRSGYAGRDPFAAGLRA